MRKDPIVAKELRVRRHSDTGILLNKASIVQRKHAYWQKLTGGARGASGTCLDSDLGTVLKMTDILAVVCFYRLLHIQTVRT